MKKFIKMTSVAIFTAVATFGIYQSQKDNLHLSELILVNVEALARYELPEVTITCNSNDYTDPGQCYVDAGDCWRLGRYQRDCEFSGTPGTSCTSVCNL